MANTLTPSAAKAAARRLRTALERGGSDPGHSGALELLAQALGARDWNTYVATAPTDDAEASPPQAVVPQLRAVDWSATRRFYVEFLGATVVWEDNPGDHVPRYAAVRLPSGALLHLSEHNGDGTPGASVLVQIPDLDAELERLTATGYGAPPAIEETGLGRSLTVYDPVGNRIVFVASMVPARPVGNEIPPIVHDLHLPMRPSAAFALFTSFSWWHDYGLAPDGHVSIDDDEVMFHNPDGAFSIGTVLIWRPGARYQQTFTLAQDPQQATTITATFNATTEGTHLRFEHGGWNEANGAGRSHFADWPLLLAGLTT